MTLKKTLPAMTLMLALLFTVSTAMAQPGGPDGKKPPKKMDQMSRMSPEDKAAWMEIWKEHREKIEPIRDQMWAKRMEYDALVANPNTQPQAVKAVIDEVLRLKVQLRGEHDKLAEAAKAKGIEHPGFHKAWRGHGPDGGFGDCPGMSPGKKGPGGHRGGHMMMND